MIYPRRSIEIEETRQFSELMACGRVQRVYLDELEEDSLGIGVVKLITTNETIAIRQAKILIEQANAQLTDPTIRRNLVDLIETIIVYKANTK